MHRLCLILLFGIASLPSPLAAQQADPVKPAATSDIGPWEAVTWTRGSKVHRCTLARAKPTSEGATFGFLVDREGNLFGIAHASFGFKSAAKLEGTFTPQHGEARKLSAEPVSNIRANVTLPRAMLDQLQRSDHLDVQIGAGKVRLPFDDFNAARVVLEACVQKLGTDHDNKQ
jgi:hypothetical protein